MKTIAILANFAAIMVMTILYVNHMHAVEVDHLRMQVQIEQTIVQAILD